MELAPIGVSTYSRLNHLKQTIEALQKNTLAKESELYIFSDAPQQGDEEIVSRVREYIHTIDGFKKVHIVERETNGRVANNRGGIKYLLDTYGRAIFLEDDNVVSTNFLEFMNDGLDFYEDNKRIMAINGYNVPTTFPNSYKHDYYLSTYFNAWGFATWKDRGFLDIVNYSDQYNEMMGNKELYKKIKKVHPKLINGLKQIHEGTLNAGDFKITFHLLKNDLNVIRPIKSKVNNIGHDGSGVHCGISNKYHHDTLCIKKIIFNDKVKYDNEIELIWRKYQDKITPFFIRAEKKLMRIIKKILGRQYG